MNLATQQRNGRIPTATERKKKRTVESGTAVRLQRPQKQKSERQIVESPPRRGPSRACKKRKQLFDDKVP
ncbi:MAG: hypothetical protein GY696_01035 [Gammaproteobacteria bacterium]|nr:hypothetical protein [Gammaproteobacteria bacterium]